MASVTQLSDVLRSSPELDDDAGDPFDVLTSILGKWLERDSPRSASSDVIIQNVIQPRQLQSRDGRPETQDTVISEGSSGTYKSSEIWRQLEDEQTKFLSLHESITACDEVLKSVELYLNSFRSELSAVSSEIEDLQERSIFINQRLDNRRVVQAMLCPAVENLLVTPSSVKKLVHGDIDEVWIKLLHDLQKNQATVDQKLRRDSKNQNLGNMRNFMTHLSDKLVERIRDHVISQIKALRHPNVDAQVIQQRSLLPSQPAFAYLAQRQSQLAIEITQAYQATIAWYYSVHFTRYKASIGKLAIRQTDHTEAMTDESYSRRIPKLIGVQEIFSLGRRIDILRAVDAAPLPSHAAEEDKGTHFMELSFGAFNETFVENAITEYAFLNKFFHEQSTATINTQFQNIFKSTFNQGYAFTKQLIENTTDALGVLICIRLTQKMAFRLQQQKVPALDNYINGTSMLLWPKFQKIIDAHCNAIRKTTSALSGKPTGTALSLTTSASTIPGTAPHFLTQRFGVFIHSLLLLSGDSGDDEPVAASLRRMLTEYDAFLTKLSKGLAETRRRDRLLYNNYSLMRTILTDLDGNLAQEAKAQIDAKCTALQQDG